MKLRTAAPLAVAAFVLLATSASLGQTPTPAPPKLLLAVDRNSSGPVGEAQSRACLLVYVDGNVHYAEYWKSGGVLTDKDTGQEITPSKTISRRYQLEDLELWDLSRFIRAKAVKKLTSNFGPPHTTIDYFEDTRIRLFGPSASPKEIVMREFGVANMEEASRYPAALIVLMHKINEIRSKAESKGNPAPIPSECRQISVRN